jgi:hypothetical protein
MNKKTKSGTKRRATKIINYDSEIGLEHRSTDAGENLLRLPPDKRCIIAGVAGCGKTNLVFNLLFNEGWMDYDKLYVYSKSLFQSKYERLRRAFEEVCPEVATFSSNNEEVIAPDILGETPGIRTVVLFDDVMIDNQQKIERYFAYGRHANASIFYLCQTYSRIPKRVIRDNANLIMLFRQDNANLKHVFNNHVGSDMTFEEFRTLCGECWNSNRFGFITIDKTKLPNQGRYRRMLD